MIRPNEFSQTLFFFLPDNGVAYSEDLFIGYGHRFGKTFIPFTVLGAENGFRYTERKKLMKNILDFAAAHGYELAAVTIVLLIIAVRFFQRRRSKTPCSERRRPYMPHGNLQLSETGIRILNTPGLPAKIVREIATKGFDQNGEVHVVHNGERLTFRQV